ncbi:indole-2-monooxygenase-like isoform X2 [Oryza brachyantha]|uniref:indole-2-monooxygenase-like isoform X2 n=1 Tax=Oryza brachyantha TaxID=4533 RepID=UPI001AD9DC36|nr:indole-2-monooxygenase-like isoform X2 [Oryza brachyantha]
MITTTHLLTVKKVRSYGLIRQQEVRLALARISKAAHDHVAVDLTELLSCYANNMVCHAVSGKFSREEGRNQLFRELVEANSSLLGGFNIEDYFPSLTRLATLKRLLLSCVKAHDVNRRWDQLLEKLIDDHTNKHEYGLTKDNIKANLVAMLAAGTDTSFIELEYSMAKLMQNPPMMAKLQADVRSIVPKGQEIVTEEQLDSMSYLKAVIKETLRLHPAAPLLIPHFSMADCNVNGYKIRSGTRVIINAWALARDSNYWKNSENFMPERFIDNITANYNGNDFHFLPFGSGRRMCPGINFAIATIKIMLANLVYHFDWELPENQVAKGGIDMTEIFGMAVHRKEKLILIPHQPCN